MRDDPAFDPWATAVREAYDALRAVVDDPCSATERRARSALAGVLSAAREVGRGQWRAGHPLYEAPPSVPLGSKVIGRVALQVGPVVLDEDFIGTVRRARRGVGYVVVGSARGAQRTMTVPWREGGFTLYTPAQGDAPALGTTGMQSA